MAAKGQELPGLYHPKQGVKGAWFEIAISPSPRRTNHFTSGSFPVFHSKET